MVKHFSEFPAVVIRSILKHACPTPDGIGVGDLNLDLSATINYSRVSRLWREEAKKLLFHQIDFTSMRRFIGMRTFIRTSPALATHVRILSLGIGENYHTHVQGSELPDIMNMFPYLYELRLFIDNPPPFSPITLGQLNSTPPIRALRLIVSETEQTIEVLLQVLQVPWPLQHLSVTRPFSRGGHWITPELFQDQKVPPWKLLEYRTDGFLDWEDLFEWIVLSSLETLIILHMPPSPQSTPLILVSPRLRSLNLVYRPKVRTIFEGMGDYPPFPVLQELNLTNATLTHDYKIYQSIPQSVTWLGTTLNIKIQPLVNILPIVPMRIEGITVYHDGKTATGLGSMLRMYSNADPRLTMKRRLANSPCMVPFHGTPRDNAVVNKEAMDRAIANRVVPLPEINRTPWLLQVFYNSFSSGPLKSP